MRFPARHGATPIADCFGENPNLKWMMAGGTPMTSEPPAMSLGSFRPRSSQPIELDGIEWYVDHVAAVAIYTILYIYTIEYVFYTHHFPMICP